MKPAASKSIALYGPVMLALIELASQAHGQNVASQDFLRDVEAAWSRRSKAITTVTMTTEIDEITKGSGKDPIVSTGPFDDAPPKEDRLLKITTDFAYKRGKAALTRSGPVLVAGDLEKTRMQTFRAAFDGRKNTSLVEESGLPMGFIERQEVGGPYITQNVVLLAVNFWLQPKVSLHEIGWLHKEMSIQAETVDVDGIQCRRIRIPRSTPRWTSTLDVDAKREFVPVQWQTWLDGRLSMRLTIKYDVDSKAGPVVKEWAYTHYNDAGDVESIRNAKVTSCQVNGNIDDSRFTIQFPVGTHVIEKIGDKRRYYLQQTDGLVPMERSNYGRLSRPVQATNEN